jgi:hypothetical protein
MSDTKFAVGDKIKVTDPSIIRELRGDHKILRLLKGWNGEYQTFISGSGLDAGEMVPETPRDDSEYVFDTIEGFVFEIGEAHPTAFTYLGSWDQKHNKFVALEVVLKIHESVPLKSHWIEKVKDSELPKCWHCRKETRNWVGDDWSCLKCEEAGITTWVSKPCYGCGGCPSWDHGGAGGCLGSPKKPCDGCAGFEPDESDDDIICSQERFDEILAQREKWAEYCRKMAEEDK